MVPPRKSLLLWLPLALSDMGCTAYTNVTSIRRHHPSRRGRLDCYPSPIHSLPLPVSQAGDHGVMDNWWCDPREEYAWLGYSYSVSDCPSRSEMIESFSWMRRVKGARYVRLYSGCDAPEFDNDVIEAAAETGVGIYALIWFGFDNDDKWKGRKERLIKAILRNPKAPFVIRAVTCGSEPLYDGVLPVEQLIKQIEELKGQLNPLGILVTLSEMPAGYQKYDNAPGIFKAVDCVSLHSFAFFEKHATTADKAGRIIEKDVQYGLEHGLGKKITIVQTGWPSNTEVWKANSPDAVADVEQEGIYFDLLGKYCQYFKAKQISWFSHVYNDSMLPGWGLVYANGSEKFQFEPRGSC